MTETKLPAVGLVTSVSTTCATTMPAIVERAGSGAKFAWNEFSLPEYGVRTRGGLICVRSTGFSDGATGDRSN